MILRDNMNNYFLHVVTDADRKPIEKTHDGAFVGIDLGCKCYATLSDGKELDLPKTIRDELEKYYIEKRYLQTLPLEEMNRKDKRNRLKHFYH